MSNEPPSPSFSPIFSVLLLLMSFLVISHQQQLDPREQESAYQVLSSINPTIPWRTLYPDDLCLSSAPHGVVCDLFPTTQNDTVTPLYVPHITEFNFGYVSDFNPNPPCSPNSTLNPLSFTSFKFLKKLFFYKCFTESNPVPFPNIPGSGDHLEELVFIDNPGLTGSLGGILANFPNLRRVVLSGNGIYGNIPGAVGNSLVNAEEVTLSRNRLTGGLPVGLSKLKNLRVLDLSFNDFKGNAPEGLGGLSRLLKLDMSHNGLSGKIPESLGELKELEFLDLSFNRFGNFGVPLFLGQMPRLKEVYLSGNTLGGVIPEIWENLGGISGIGFSSMGLTGSIPGSMGLHLRQLCYLGLDNNNLQGDFPAEFGSLESIREINVENNNLTGRVPFSAQFTAAKLKLKGNSGLCVDGDGLKHKGGIQGSWEVCEKVGDFLKPGAVVVSSNEGSQSLVASFSGAGASASGGSFVPWVGCCFCWVFVFLWL